MKNKKWITTLLSATLTAGLLFGCGNADKTEGKVNEEASVENATVEGEKSYDGLEIHLATFSGQYTINLAYELGFLDDEFGKDGITFTTSQFIDGPSAMESFAAGAVDFGTFGDQPVIAGVSNGTGVEIIGCYADVSKIQYFVASANSGVKTLEDLAGKNVAVPAGTTYHQDLLLMMKHYGYTEDDFNLTYMGVGDIVTALQTGDIDVGCIMDPQASTAVANGGSFIEDVSNYKTVINVLVGRTEFTEKYPELTARFIQVLQKTDEWIKNNPEEAAKKVADMYELDYETTLETLNKTDLHLNLSEDDIVSLNQTAQFIYDQGMVENLLTDGDFVNLSYLEAAGIQ